MMRLFCTLCYNSSVDTVQKTPLVYAQELLVELAIEQAYSKDNPSDVDERFTVAESMLEREDQAILKELSSELFMLEDDEMFYVGSEEPLTDEEVRVLIADSNWTQLLKILQTDYKNLTPWVRAYLRGMCYANLGLHAAAWAFYKIAGDKYEDVLYDPAFEKEIRSFLFKLRYWATESLKIWNPDQASKEAFEVLNSSTPVHPILVRQNAKIVGVSPITLALKGSEETLDDDAKVKMMLDYWQESDRWPVCEDENFLCIALNELKVRHQALIDESEL